MAGRSVIIVGAGLAGCLLACYLARAGWRVRVFERRGDPRARGYQGGRSINLALSARGLDGLAGVGLDRHVLERDAIPMAGRALHPPGPSGAPGGAVVFQPYSADPREAINSVSRGGLNLSLLNEAASLPGVEFFFDHPCVDVDLNAPAVLVADASRTPHAAPTRVEADLVASADGAFSAVRLVMMKTDRFEYSQSYLEHGYKELHIPPAADLGIGRERAFALRGGDGHAAFALDPHALHIWPRGGAMMIALPNRDGSFTCTLFWPFTGPHGFDALTDAARVRAFFEEHYADAVPLMPRLTDDFLGNPTSSLVTIRCAPWQRGGRVVLLGDASHAIVPFYGQGMNAAFEDCKALAACLAAHRDQREALERFDATRKPDADAIADMALENFIEMRDLAGRADFQHRKRLEQSLHRVVGEAATPQYNLVSFSTVRYAEARRRGQRVAAAVRRLAGETGDGPGLTPGDLKGLDAPAVDALVRAALPRLFGQGGVEAFLAEATA